jgi:SAM-dependent methyltransferase
MKWLSVFADGKSKEIHSLRKERDALEKRVQELMLCGAPSELDRTLYPYPLPPTIDIWGYLSGFANRKDCSILEIGAREVVGKSPCKTHMPLAQYTGFDFHEGPNVDVVGDAHKLTDYFEPKSIDVVVSIAVFEHLAMPWVVAEEISKVLRVGGVACIATHFSWSEHEMPWHFFQFNSTGLEVLFNKTLGFQTVEAGKGMPMVGRFAFDCDANHAGKPIAHLYCSSYVVTKKVADASGGHAAECFEWRSALKDVYGKSEYPQGTSVLDPAG